MASKVMDFAALGKRKWVPPDGVRRSELVAQENDANGAAPSENAFELDNQVHLDFIEAATNLRSMNYGLGRIDRLFAQKVAGKVQATVSTTASICSAGMFTGFAVSLVTPEFACRGKYVVSPFSLMTFRECATPMKRFGDTNQLFSPWDFLRFDGNVTLDEARQAVEEKANRRIALWATSNGLILPLDGQPFGMKGSVTDTFNELFPATNAAIQIEISLEMMDGKELAAPPILVRLNSQNYTT
jgi:ubiquitin-activating enzyme E1